MRLVLALSLAMIVSCGTQARAQGLTQLNAEGARPRSHSQSTAPASSWALAVRSAPASRTAWASVLRSSELQPVGGSATLVWVSFAGSRRVGYWLEASGRAEDGEITTQRSPSDDAAAADLPIQSVSRQREFVSAACALDGVIEVRFGLPEPRQ